MASETVNSGAPDERILQTVSGESESARLDSLRSEGPAIGDLPDSVWQIRPASGHPK